NPTHIPARYTPSRLAERRRPPANPFQAVERRRIAHELRQKYRRSFDGSHFFSQLQPASTIKSCAVHFSAASEARNSPMFATSPGSTRFFKHWPAITSFSKSGVFHNLICRSVKTAPGEFVFTSIPNGTSSRSRTRDKTVTEALLTFTLGT